MIALDTSALVAIALEEADADRFRVRIGDSDAHVIGTPTVFELRIVLTARIGPEVAEQAIALVLPERCRVAPFDAAHLAAASAAFDRFGKGRHPAALNYGDCMAYAVAHVAGCPLLYKGEDFARTDIRSAL